MKKMIFKEMPVGTIFKHDEYGDIICKLTSAGEYVPIDEAGKKIEGYEFQADAGEMEMEVFIVSMPPPQFDAKKILQEKREWWRKRGYHGIVKF